PRHRRGLACAGRRHAGRSGTAAGAGLAGAGAGGRAMNVLVCLCTTTRATADALDVGDGRALALALKLRGSGNTVTALYAASTADAPAIGARLAPLVDRAVHVVSDELAAADFHTVGQMLSMAIRRIGVDLVLSPIQSEDQGACGIPAALARNLGARYVAMVEDIPALTPSGVEVLVRGGGLERRLRVTTPAVLATAPGPTALPQVAAAPATAAAIETIALTDPEATVVRRRTELLGRTETASRGTQTVTSASELIAALARR